MELDFRFLKMYLREAQRSRLDKGIRFWPESPETLINQLERVRQNKKKIMLFHKLPAKFLPDELIDYFQHHKELDYVDTVEGIFVYNILSIKRRQIFLALSEGLEAIGKLLGYGVDGLPPQEGSFVLRLMSGTGVEKESIVCNDANKDIAIRALMVWFEEGDSLDVQGREEFRRERIAPFKEK
jgi:hypothetical protein